MGCGPVQDGLGRVARSRDDGPSLTPHFPASGFGRGIQCWALPCSLAATEGILVSFGLRLSPNIDLTSSRDLSLVSDTTIAPFRDRASWPPLYGACFTSKGRRKTGGLLSAPRRYFVLTDRPLSRLGMSCSRNFPHVAHPTRSDVSVHTTLLANVTETEQSLKLTRPSARSGPGTEYPRTAMCVRNVDVHVSCSSQVDAQLAAFFIDPRAK
jgi:hypothetical protein